MIRVFQFSDTHLSPRTSRFRDNYHAVAAQLRTARYDLIVHTGDISLDGLCHEEDFVLCRELFGELGQPVLFLPGNHDIGNHPAMAKGSDESWSGVNEERLLRYRHYFGMDYWSHDLDGWRFIGLNSMICGSGLPQEEQQFAWLEKVLGTTSNRRLAVFIHQPLFLDDPAETGLNYWCVDPAVRARLTALFDHPNLRLITSGHLHQRRAARYRGAALQWCSSTAFVAGLQLVPDMGGDRTVGCLEHRFNADDVETHTVLPAGMTNCFIDSFITEIYPLL